MICFRSARMVRPALKTTSRIDHAFTLIELAFVTALLAVLVAVSVPKFQRTANRLRLEQASAQLTQTLRYARERAVGEGREVDWIWDERARQSHLEALGETEQVERLDERAADRAVLPPAAILDLMRDGQLVDCRCVRFFPDGTGDPTTLTLKKNQETLYTITIHGATGQACLAAGAAAC